MKSSELYDIATKYKTLSFVFDAEAVQTRVHEIKTIIGDDINLCFSVKANPFLFLSSMMIYTILKYVVRENWLFVNRIRYQGKR